MPIDHPRKRPPKEQTLQLTLQLFLRCSIIELKALEA
jgi:hypothetical protein